MMFAIKIGVTNPDVHRVKHGVYRLFEQRLVGYEPRFEQWESAGERDGVAKVRIAHGEYDEPVVGNILLEAIGHRGDELVGLLVDRP